MKTTSKTKQYFLIMKQENQGCDYTIGCGTTIETLEATTMKQAIEEAMELGFWQEEIDLINKNNPDEIEDYVSDFINDTNLRYIDNKEQPMQTISILEVSDEKNMLPILKDKLNEVNKYVNKIKNKSQENEEKKMYEKLKKKYG